MNTKITFSDLTFCVQGQVSISLSGENQTEKLIESIFRFFPGSPVVFATWKNQRAGILQRQGLRIVELDDPGSLPREDGSTSPNNINRQIRSSKAALELATTRFAIKIRSDMIFKSNRLIRLLDRLPDTIQSPYSWFEKYVLVHDRLTLDPFGELPFPMHPADHIQAGLLIDLRRYWGMPEMSASDESYFLDGKDGGLDASQGHIPRHRAESYFWKEAVRVFSGQDLHSLLTKEEDLALSTRDSFAHNLIPVNKRSLGIDSQKYSWGAELGIFTYAYVYADWLGDTKKMRPRPGRLPVSLIETIGRFYRRLVRVKNILLRRESQIKNIRRKKD